MGRVANVTFLLALSAALTGLLSFRDGSRDREGLHIGLLDDRGGAKDALALRSKHCVAENSGLRGAFRI